MPSDLGANSDRAVKERRVLVEGGKAEEAVPLRRAHPIGALAV